MADLVRGCQVGPWVVFHDEDGGRYAVRQKAILAVSEAATRAGRPPPS